MVLDLEPVVPSRIFLPIILSLTTIWNGREKEFNQQVSDLQLHLSEPLNLQQFQNLSSLNLKFKATIPHLKALNFDLNPELWLLQLQVQVGIIMQYQDSMVDLQE